MSSEANKINSGLVNEAPLVSVIINCYNGEKYLREAIDSVIAQTYENWEIIFWDNQSDDDSALIVHGYEDQRIKYYKTDQFTPLGEARNLAMEKATGEWCAFLDCDDMWYLDKLEKQIDIIINDNDVLGVVYGRMVVVSKVYSNSNATGVWEHSMSKYTNEYLLKELPEWDIFNKLLCFNFVPLLTALFKRQFYWNVGGIGSNYNISEDYDLFLKLAHIKHFRAIQTPVAQYRVHGDNLSSNNMEKGYFESVDIVSQYLPNEDAKHAIKYHHTVYAVRLLKSGQVIDSVRQIIFNGSLRSLLEMVLIKVTGRFLKFHSVY